MTRPPAAKTRPTPRGRGAVAPVAFGILVIASILALGGCTVGEGTGSATGSIFDVGCDNVDSLKTAQPYSLQPTFFAGEPIEDICPPPGQCAGPRMNRLIIRLQRNGNRVEVNDTLYVDVLNSYKVAQCVRGQTMGGVPKWDTRMVTAADGSPIPGLPWCDWNSGAAPDGGAPDAGVTDAGVADAGVADGGAPAPMAAARARINLSTQDYVQASFSPLHTCVEARSVAVALPGSWIEFEDFGSAIQDVPAEMRTDITGDFKVDFGQRLRASFHLILGDQAVENAMTTHMSVPDERIGGQLDGSFDFDLERGRAAQAFP